VIKQAVLYLSHEVNSTQWRAFERLKAECCGLADVYYVANLSDDNVPREFEKTFPITPSMRAALGHPSRLGSVGWWMDTTPSHLGAIRSGFDQALLAFRQTKPNYDYYWILEYDVELSGRWSDFFNAFADNVSDILCSNVHRYETNPEWSWWRSVKWPDEMKPELIRGFFPLARLSARAIDAVIDAGRHGVDGFYETVWPMVACSRGMSIEDFGGNGEFVRPENVNRWYSSTITSHTFAPGTFVARPIRFRPGSKPNTLWHPVKRHFVSHILSRLRQRMSPNWWRRPQTRPT